MDQHQRFALAIDLVINLDAIHRCEAEAHQLVFHLLGAVAGSADPAVFIMRQRALAALLNMPDRMPL